MHVRYLYYSILFKEEEDDIKDVYKKFAYDYDEFGDIKDYLGPEKELHTLLYRPPKVRSKSNDWEVGIFMPKYILTKNENYRILTKRDEMVKKGRSQCLKYILKKKKSRLYKG